MLTYLFFYFFYSFKVLAKEVGDGFNITTLLNDSSGWRGRQQQITSLQNKVKFVLKLFLTSGVFSAASNISNTRTSVSSDIQTPRRGWKNDAQPSFFLTNFKVFGYRMKHPFECWIWLLKPLIILGENQSKSSPNFMIMKITYPNLLHGCNFLYFISMNY